MGKETLKQMSIDVNNTQANSVKESLHQFLEQHETIKSTKEQLNPLFAEVVSSDEVAEKMESTINKDHIKNLLVAMQNEFKSDGSNYTDVYSKWGKSIVFGLQSALRIMGYKIGVDEIDGRYGPQTARAVSQYQTLHKLNVDGSAGYETFSSLMNANLDQKITEEESNIEPNKDAHIQTEKSVDDPFFVATPYVEQIFGNEVNKVYTVINYVDIPESIPPKTVVDFGNKRFFSNGLVIEINEKRTIVRRGMRNTDLDLEGNWNSPVVDTKIPIVDNEKITDTVNITADNMTFDQLQYNIDAIWKKYFTFDKKRQKEFITKRHLEDGISVEGTPHGINVRSKGSSYYYQPIDASLYVEDTGLINTKKVINTIRENMISMMDNQYYSNMLKEKIDTKYVTRDKIFTKDELADTTSILGKKLHDFISYFEKGAHVEVQRKGGQYAINRNNGNTYFSYTFETNKKAPWNENVNVVAMKNILNPDGTFNQAKWNEQVRNMIITKKISHTYFTKFDTKNI